MDKLHAGTARRRPRPVKDLTATVLTRHSWTVLKVSHPLEYVRRCTFTVRRSLIEFRSVGKEFTDGTRAVADSSVHREYPGQLSGGQQQRVGVARALVNDPDILLMDEPFSAVDPIVRGELQNEMLRLQQELKKTIVFVTHDIEEAFAMGDQVVVLKAVKEIAQVGAPVDILAQPADDFVAKFIGLDHGGRNLRIQHSHGRQIVVDNQGRPTGVLE